MNENELQGKALRFLHKWVNEGKVANMRKGMVEDLENFVNDILADKEMSQAAARMTQAKPVQAPSGENDEKNS